MNITSEDIENGSIPFLGDSKPVSIYRGTDVIFEPTVTTITSEENNITIDNTYNYAFDSVVVGGNTSQKHKKLSQITYNKTQEITDLSEETIKPTCNENLMREHLFDWDLSRADKEDTNSYFMSHAVSTEESMWSQSGTEKSWYITTDEDVEVNPNEIPMLYYKGPDGYHVFTTKVYGTGTFTFGYPPHEKKVVLSPIAKNAVEVSVLTNAQGEIRIIPELPLSDSKIKMYHFDDKLEDSSTTPWIPAVYDQELEENPISVPSHNVRGVSINIPAKENLIDSDSYLWVDKEIDEDELLLTITDDELNGVTFEELNGQWVNASVEIERLSINGASMKLKITHTDNTKEYLDCNSVGKGRGLSDLNFVINNVSKIEVFIDGYKNPKEDFTYFYKYRHIKLEHSSRFEKATAWIPSKRELENGMSMPLYEVECFGSNWLDFDKLNGKTTPDGKFVRIDNEYDETALEYKYYIPLNPYFMYFFKVFAYTDKGWSGEFQVQYYDGTVESFDIESGHDNPDNCVFSEGCTSRIKSPKNFVLSYRSGSIYIQKNVGYLYHYGKDNKSQMYAGKTHYVTPNKTTTVFLPNNDNDSYNIVCDVPYNMQYITNDAEEGPSPSEYFPEIIESVGGVMNINNGGDSSQEIEIPRLSRIGDRADKLHIDRLNKRMWIERWIAEERAVSDSSWKTATLNSMEDTDFNYRYFNNDIEFDDSYPMYCNVLPYYRDASTASHPCIGPYHDASNNQYCMLFVHPDYANDETKPNECTAFKQYLDNNEVIVSFVMQYPVIEELDYDENIETYYPETHIEYDGLETSVSVTMKTFK